MASSGSEQQLRFRWNDHMQHISKVLTLQRFEEQFCDVTLVSDDGFVMKAHQAILASTSAYFQRVFSEITADQHPMVVLRGANFRELSCLLDYMYQGSTQVHQSLMEAVLEVADMLEVKGLSQIRSNNSIKKFMAPLSSNSTNANTTSSSHVHLGDDNGATNSRSAEDQSESHTPEEQVYKDSENRPSELENSWMRFPGSNATETRSKESAQAHDEGTVTTSEELPQSSHVPMLPCQETNSPETQEESQVSGMDLSMAKNEPWSPRDSSPNRDKNSPSRKRRKLLESICSEETIEPASDPDWGRTVSKVDERTLCQPRTISFTSITSEQGSSSGAHENKESSVRCSAKSECQQDTLLCEKLSHDTLSLSSMHSLNLPASNEQEETESSKAQFLTSSYHICSCRGPCKVNLNHPESSVRDRVRCQIERNVSKESLKLELPETGNQSIESDSHTNDSFFNSCNTKVDSTLHTQETFEIERVCNLKDPDDDESNTVIIPLNAPDFAFPAFPQSSCNESICPENRHETKLDSKYSETYNKQADTESLSKPHTECLNNTQPLINSEISGTKVELEDTCSGTDISVYIIEGEQMLDKGSETEDKISAARFVCIDTKNFGRTGPVDTVSGSRDPLEIPESSTDSARASSDKGEDTRLTSLVSVTHKERIMVKHSVPKEKPGCPLEKRLVRPKSTVKRPCNPFILFQNEMKKKIMEDYPGEHYQVTLKRLGIMWRNLSQSDKQKWQTKADNLKREHQIQNPDYHYNPYEAFMKRQQYLKARMERNRLYRVSSDSSVEDDSAGMVSPNLYRTLKKNT